MQTPHEIDDNRRDFFIKWFKYLLLTLPVIFGFIIVRRYGVNCVFWDEWDSIIYSTNDFFEHGIKFKSLFAQHNEHRIFLPRIVCLLNALLTHCDIKALMYVSWAFATATYLIYLRYLQSAAGNLPKNNVAVLLFGLAIGGCVFNVVQHQNILWGFQMAWYMVAFFSALSFYCFHLWLVTGKIRYSFFVCLLGIAASSALLHGLFVLPSILAVTILLGITQLKIPWKFFSLVLATTVFTFFAYFYDYHKPPGHPAYFGLTAENLIKYYLCALGAPLQLFFPNPTSLAILGAIIFLGEIASIFYLIVCKKIQAHAFSLCLICFACVFLMSITTGRAGFGVGHALTSRYTTVALINIIGFALLIYKEFVSNNHTNGIKKFVSQGMCFLLTLLLLQNFRIEVLVANYNGRINLRDITLDYKNRSENDLVKLHPKFNNLDNAKNRIKILEDRQWSVFHRYKARESLLEKWSRSDVERVYTLSAAADLRNRHDIGQVEIKDHSVILQATGSDPYFSLPVKFERGYDYAVVINARGASHNFQLFYTTVAQTKFNQKESISFAIHPARDVFVELPQSNEFFNLRLDTGVKPGEYSIEKFQVLRIKKQDVVKEK